MKRKKISPVNMKAIEDFLIHEKARIGNPNTINNHLSYLRMFLNQENGVKKDYNKLTQRDLDLFFGSDHLKPTTREVIKQVSKNFFKFHNLAELADGIITNGGVLAKPIKDDTSVLTAEEINTLIETPIEPDRKALIETFIVTGARKDEIRNLNLGDVSIEPDLIWVNIRESKTKVRKVPIAPDPSNPVARNPEYLKIWVRSRYGEDPDSPLFYSHSYNSNLKGGRMSLPGLYGVINTIKKQSGIKKRISPHIFRHTAATYDGVSLPEQMLCQKYGWVVGSPMARRYCHFNEKQLGEEILKRAGLKPDEAKKGKPCFNCGEINNLFARECVKCHQILDPQKLKEIAQTKSEDVETLKQKMKEMEQAIDSLADHLTWFMNEAERLWKIRLENKPDLLKILEKG